MKQVPCVLVAVAAVCVQGVTAVRSNRYSNSYSRPSDGAYSYSYAVGDDKYDSSRYSAGEARNSLGTQGSYSVDLPDGRVQTVNYNVPNDDVSGYRASVTYSGQPNFLTGSQYSTAFTPASTYAIGASGYQPSTLLPAYQAALPAYQASLPVYQASLPAYQTASLPAYQASLPAYQASLPAYQVASLPAYQAASVPAYQTGLPTPQSTLSAYHATMPSYQANLRAYPSLLTSAYQNGLTSLYNRNDDLSSYQSTASSLRYNPVHRTPAVYRVSPTYATGSAEY